ncbi:MAG: squalene/phytoene synthase family protein, partial [Burkholderiales bacterium]
PGDEAQWAALGDAVRVHGLPWQPFYDLLSAFEQDVRCQRYPDFEALLDYCRR